MTIQNIVTTYQFYLHRFVLNREGQGVNNLYAMKKNITILAQRSNALNFVVFSCFFLLLLLRCVTKVNPNTMESKEYMHYGPKLHFYSVRITFLKY